MCDGGTGVTLNTKPSIGGCVWMCLDMTALSVPRLIRHLSSGSSCRDVDSEKPRVVILAVNRCLVSGSR